MNSVKPRVLVIAVVLLTGCGEKAPEIPPPEPTAAFVVPSLAPSALQSVPGL